MRGTGVIWSLANWSNYSLSDGGGSVGIVETKTDLWAVVDCTLFWLYCAKVGYRKIIFHYNCIDLQYRKKKTYKVSSIADYIAFITVNIIGSTSLHILYILYGTKTVFTHTAITPPKMNQFRWNLEQCKPNVRGLALADFGRDPRSSDSLKGSFKNAKIAH